MVVDPLQKIAELTFICFDFVSIIYMPRSERGNTYRLTLNLKTGLLDIEEQHIDILENFAIEAGVKGKRKWIEEDL